MESPAPNGRASVNIGQSRELGRGAGGIIFWGMQGLARIQIRISHRAGAKRRRIPLTHIPFFQAISN
jgi:hypothetical protein